jgi:phosphatidate cytidylyltransferase
VLARRALSAAVFVPPLLVVLALGEPWFALLVGLFVAVAAWEAARLLRGAGYPAIASVSVCGSVLVAIEAASFSQLRQYGDLLLAGLVVAASLPALGEKDTRKGLAVWIGTAFAAVYAGMLGCLVRVFEIAPPLADTAPLHVLGGQRGWTLLVILLVWAYDTGAYCVGTPLGKRKFLTHISPSKSYWGLFGGLTASTIVAVAGLWALDQPPVMGVALGPFMGLVAQAGDLAESLLKRAAGAKDSGSLIPGHGGMLDRVDSFLFAAPVAALFVTAVVR